MVVDEEDIRLQPVCLAQQVHDELHGGALLRLVGERVSNVQEGQHEALGGVAGCRRDGGTTRFCRQLQQSERQRKS